MLPDTPSACTDNEGAADPNLDRGWAWLILVSALLTHLLTFGLAYASVGAFYVELLNEFGQSEAATSWTGSILLGVMLCSGPISSLLVARFGAMVTAVTGGAFASSGLALSSLAPRLTYLYVTFGVLTGLGFGLSYLPCIVMLGKFFENRRSMACGLAVSGSGMGTFIFAPLTQYCINALGWRLTFVVLGGFCLILCGCGATYRTDKLPKKFQDEEGNLAVTASSSSVFLFFSDVASSMMADTGATPSVMTILPSERDAETQTTISCVSGERILRNQLLAGDAGSVQMNASNNAICEGFHCNPDKYNEDGTLRHPSFNPIPPPPPPPALKTKYMEKLAKLKAKQKPTPEPVVSEEQYCIPEKQEVDEELPHLDEQVKTPSPPPSPVTATIETTALTSTPTFFAPSEESRKLPFSPSISLASIKEVEPPIIVVTNLDRPADNREHKRSSTTVLVDQSDPPSRRFQLGRYLGPCQVFAPLIKNTFFILFCLSNLILCIGYQLPYMYFKAFALSLNISENDWSYILSVMGITDMVGRIVVGFIFDRITDAYGRLFGFMTAAVMAGVFLFAISFAKGFMGLAVLASLYTLLAGSTDSLVPALLAHFVGVDTLAYSFGMVIEMQGSGFLIGPPLAGTLYEVFGGQYSVVFYTGGLAFVLAGLVLLLQPILAGKLPTCCCNRCRR